MADEGALADLVRSLDLSALLSRAVDVVEQIEPVGAEEREPVRAPYPRDLVHDSPASRRIFPETSGAAARASSASSPLATLTSSRAMQIHVAAPVVSRTRETPTARDAKQPASLHSDVLDRPTPLDERPMLSTEARIGATARVLLDAPDPEIARVLTIGDPTLTSASDNTLSSRTLASPRPEPASRATAGQSPKTPKPQSPAVATLGSASIASRTTAISGPPEAGVAGFRGLAARAAHESGGDRHIPVRLEPETRMPGELALDALDARVADSLARILQREARRHGIDLAEART
jgi:hypothetical protein